MQSKIMNPGHYNELRPLTRGIAFTERPRSSSPCRTMSRASSASSVRSSFRSSVLSVPDPDLSLRDIERIIFQRVNEIAEDLKNAFLTLDVDQALTVTRGQLYRVLKNFILPLTPPQFEELLSKIPVLDNGTIPYLEFLAQFHRAGTSGSLVKRRWSCSQANQVMTLNELETRLKQMISKNLKNIVRSCRLFDYNQNGQIQKHELRRVLENYCFKMKTVEYEKLWNRYCIGKKHTLDYKELLRNLGINVEQQNKSSPESVAQALNWEATKLEREKKKSWRLSSPSKRFNADDYTLEDLEGMFRKKISSSLRDLVKAFRSFDVDHTGCVPLDAFKSVINNFIFPLPDPTFHELMRRFKFRSTDQVSWEDFLQKFRRPAGIENGQTLPMKSNHRVNSVKAKDLYFSNDHILQKLHQHFQEAYPSLKQAFLVLDETGHKWLNNTRQLAKQTPVLLSLDTVETILREKIITHWKDFSKAVQACDTTGSGVVARDQLRRILQSYCPSVSDDHCQMIFDRYNSGSSDGVPFMQFLHDLGVTVSCPGDVNGVSTDIFERNQFQEELRQCDHSDRMREIEHQASNLIRKITVEEVIDKLKDCVTRRGFSVKESFLANKQPNGKVTKKDFRKVLLDHELHLDEDQFNTLTEKLGFTKDGLSYLDFVSLFEVPSGEGPGEKLQTSPNHRVNKTKFHYMTAEECLGQLLDKLREGYGDTYSSFYKIDSNRDGLITMHDFRQLLDGFMFIITQKEYERLLGLLGLNLTSTLNYTEFLNLLRRQEKADCPPWLNSFYRPKQSQDCADLACDQAHYYLVTKAQGRWHDLAKTFCEIDGDGNGIIQKKDLRNVLYRFSLPITKNEFEKLWERYDPEGKGHLTHQEFLQKLGVNFATGDSGPSKRIIEDNQETLEKHYSSQQKILKDMQEFHKHQTRALDMKDVEQQIKDKFREYYPDFARAFAKIDKNKDGLITVDDFRQMLEDLNFHLDDDQFLNLLYRLRLRVLDNKLSYFDFLKMIDDGRASKYGQRQEMIVPTENVQNLNPQKILVKLKESVKNSQEELHKAFSAFDKDDTGTIKPSELHRILDSFCFKLTDKQFKYVLSKLALNESRTIDWKSFLHNFSTFTVEPVSTWVERVEWATRPRSSQELTMRDIVAHIQEVMAARFYSITKELFHIDYSGINVISKEDFREFFLKNFMLLTDDQFELLWNILPLNPYGNLKYHDFLKMFSSEVPTTPVPLPRNAEPNYKSESSVTQGRTSVTRRPKTAPSNLNKPPTPPQRPHTAAPRPTPMVNCEHVENKLRSKISKCWEDVHRAFRDKDQEKEGQVTSANFSAVLRQFNVDVTEEELETLALKYDLRNDGKVSYSDFLRNVTLGTTPPKNALLQRMKLQKPRIPMSTGLFGPNFLDAMLRIQPKILNNWRPMRRTFQSYDETRSGYINIQDFKQVLRKFGANLSEDEFFHILGYFDKDFKSKISYNDFLSEFLK
ncbi:EF-hand calcium-binding domain-containing protein 6 isoform X2 [Engystomops pustulosus]|uniref:EF-hand calcium-binding domain-containing protein 6 isoform X2 n=1 Tax=Engystomops pustulosus TaxID=76066 RepID=UPI003AFA7C4F